MKKIRCSAPLSIVLWLVGTTAPAAPLLPTTVQTQWRYQMTDSSGASGSSSFTVSIAAEEKIAGRTVYRLETLAAGELIKTEWLSIDDRGLHCHRRRGRDGTTATFDPPQTILPGPLKIGNRWTYADQVDGVNTPQRFTVAGREEVTVPAGKFPAFRLTCEQPWPISSMLERWFVPGHGFIKEIATTRGPNGRLLSRTTAVLENVSVASPQAQPPSVEITNAVSAATAAPAANDSAAVATAPAPEAAAAPASPAEPQAEPPGPLRIALQVAATRDGDSAEEYKSNTPELFITWGGENLPAEAEVRVAWVAEDVGDIVPPNFVVDETTTIATTPEFSARFTLSRPKDGWAAGKYRAQLFVNEALAAEAKVTIRD